ncbi:MAG TPA: hypothetical protein VLM89_01480 [Phycisphaerae bacterium]|nr:hypothetical protein [Phycisphaerae bacterium]
MNPGPDDESRESVTRRRFVSDQAWYTEWPRIREVETERFLMDIHGMFYEVPRQVCGGHNFLVGEPQSNLWFGKTDGLWSFGATYPASKTVSD